MDEDNLDSKARDEPENISRPARFRPFSSPIEKDKSRDMISDVRRKFRTGAER